MLTLSPYVLLVICPTALSQTLSGYPNQVTSSPLNIFNPPATLTFGNASSSCPMTTLGISGFASNGDNWALFNNNVSTGRTGSGNYGVTAGINVPLDAALTRACKDSFASYIRSQKLTNDANLVSACVKLAAANVDLDDPDFTAKFPDVGLCKSVKPLKAAKGSAELESLPGLRSTSGKFSPEALPRNGFTFSAPQTPLIQTLPIQPQ